MRQRARVLAAGSAILAVALSITVGVAIGVLPGSWRPYFWLAWPASLALALAYAVVEARRASAEGVAGAARSQFGRSRARLQLLRRVERNWIGEVLESSLYQEARLQIGLESSVSEPHPWASASAKQRGVPEPVPPSKSLIEVFDSLDQAMLILGAPGSGKTTKMLELLRDLLGKAKEDKAAPIPVVLPLASWALPSKPQPLADWLVREIAEKYSVERRYVRAWLERGQLALLLDGLDEVATGRSEACIKAINDFRREHGTMPSAVACRTFEYEHFKTALSVYGTLTVLPLTARQIEDFLDRPDTCLAEMRSALTRQPELIEIISTPLMLNIMILAFRAAGTFGDVSGAARQGLLNRLFELYVRDRIGTQSVRGHSAESFVRRLAFLARQLQRDEQTVFDADLLTPLSLPAGPWWVMALGLVSPLVWVAGSVLSMAGIAMAFYGYRGAVVGGIAGLASACPSRSRITSYSLRLGPSVTGDSVSQMPSDETERDLPGALSILREGLSDAQMERLIAELEGAVLRELSEGFLQGKLSEADVKFVRQKVQDLWNPEAHRSRLRHVVTPRSDRRLQRIVLGLSGEDLTALVSLLKRTLLEQLTGGLLSDAFSDDDARLLQEQLSTPSESVITEWLDPLEAEPELGDDVRRILASADPSWRVRVLQFGVGSLRRWVRFRASLQAWSPALGEVSVPGVLVVLVVGSTAGIALGWAYALATVLGGLIALLATTVTWAGIVDAARHHLAWDFPSPGLRATIRLGVPTALVIGLLSGAVAGAAIAVAAGLGNGLRLGVAMTTCTAIFVSGCFGISASIEQVQIRLTLAWSDLLPVRCRAFLDFAMECLFLQRAGESYMFIHRSFQEFLAAFCPADTNDPNPRLVAILISGVPRAQEGDISAQYNLAALLENRLDPPDLDGARTWYTRAAEVGHVAAQINLGLMLAREGNQAEAQVWLTKAALAGNADAQFNLGLLLEDSLDPPDLDGARDWYTRAAEAGHIKAAVNLAALTARIDDGTRPGGS